MVNPCVSAVGTSPLIVLFVRLSVPDKVATVPLVGKVKLVIPVLVSVVL